MGSENKPAKFIFNLDDVSKDKKTSNPSDFSKDEQTPSSNNTPNVTPPQGNQ